MFGHRPARTYSAPDLWCVPNTKCFSCRSDTLSAHRPFCEPDWTKAGKPGFFISAAVGVSSFLPERWGGGEVVAVSSDTLSALAVADKRYEDRQSGVSVAEPPG
jgi:hypothetical protein